jgi:hypothetical protein
MHDSRLGVHEPLAASPVVPMGNQMWSYVDESVRLVSRSHSTTIATASLTVGDVGGSPYWTTMQADNLYTNGGC